jgi:phage-related protein
VCSSDLSTLYEEDSVVINGNNYYYARRRHTSTSSFSTDLNTSNFWKGVLTYNGETRPYFEWRASYGMSVEKKPNVRNIQFGDNYIQSVQDGINNALLKINIEFNDRSLSEAKAILHFLEARNGVTKFFFIPPAPYNDIKLFVCQEWQPTQVFYDKYNITARFEERVL